MLSNHTQVDRNPWLVVAVAASSTACCVTMCRRRVHTIPTVPTTAAVAVAVIKHLIKRDDVFVVIRTGTVFCEKERVVTIVIKTVQV